MYRVQVGGDGGGWMVVMDGGVMETKLSSLLFRGIFTPTGAFSH